MLYTFFPKILFGQLLDISQKNFILLKTFDPGFSYDGMWFTEKNSKPSEIKEKITITLVIN